MQMVRLYPTKFGLAGGILWGFYLFLAVPIYYYTGYGGKFLQFVADLYPGVEVSILGALTALIWGFFDGFICLTLFAWIYNKLLRT